MKPIKLVYSAFRPMNSTPEVLTVEWTKKVEEATGGRVIIETVSGAKLGAAEEHMDMVQAGVLCQIASPWPSYSTPGRFPMADIQSIPMLSPSGEVTGRALHELYTEYCVPREFKHIKLLFLCPLASTQLISNKPVRKLEDWKGLKVHATSGIMKDGYMALGANVININKLYKVIPASAKYEAYKDGKMDASIFTWSGVLEFGLEKIAKYRTKCDYINKTWVVVMNLKTFNSLPPDIQKIIDDLSGPEQSAYIGRCIDAEQEEARLKLEAIDKENGNPPIYDLPKAERERWKQALKPAVDRWIANLEKDGLPGKEYYNRALDLIAKYSK